MELRFLQKDMYYGGNRIINAKIIVLMLKQMQKLIGVLHTLKSVSVRKMNRPNYKKALNILMEYWDSLPDEEKPKIDKELKKVGC